MEETLEQALSQVEAIFALGKDGPPLDESAIVALIADRVSELLEEQPGYLMSLLYRLDVLEEKILPVVRGQSEEPIPLALARLIWERQKQRIATRRQVKPLPMDEETEEWRW
ncbi:MAG: hypothetical protein NZM43_11130 [Saprospiraceae bacterium]|nr:hypothetical protein [Saprospiraceae bacterium]MDW8484860.1 hypothetical protein [Saprospiraceae bacterium]